MRNRFAVTLAVFAVLSVATSFTAQADTNSSQPSLAIQGVCGQGSHLYDIRNVGNVTAANLTYTICAGASEFMPPLKTWTLPLFQLAPGQTFQLSVPSSAF